MWWSRVKYGELKRIMKSEATENAKLWSQVSRAVTCKLPAWQFHTDYTLPVINSCFRTWGASQQIFSHTPLCIFYVWSPSILLVRHTTLDGAVLTVIEACGQRPSCVRRSLICFLTYILTTTQPFILHSATSATRSVYSPRLSKSFLNLRLGLGTLNYVFAWVICVLGSYWCRAGWSFIHISNFVCCVSGSTTQVYYLVFTNTSRLYFLHVHVVHLKSATASHQTLFSERKYL